MPKGHTDVSEGIAPKRFSLTIDGYEIAAFSQLIAIASEAEPDDLAGSLLKKLPGKRKPPTVTLRRAMTSDLQVATWHEASLSGPSEAKKSASLVMYNPAGEPVARYHLENAWVPRIEIGALTAEGGGPLFETITIACDSLQRVSA